MAWTATDNLDSYSDGDLNGGSGGSNWATNWSGSTNWDIQGSVVYQGTKAALNTAVGGGVISRTYSAISAGSMYIAMRRSLDNLGAGFEVALKSGSTFVCEVSSFQTGGNTRWYILDSNTTWVSIGSITANQWYIINIEFDDAAQDNKYRARIHDGTSWGSFSSWVGTANAYTTVDTISITSPGGETSAYFDTIQDTDPTIVTTDTSKFFLMF